MESNLKYTQVKPNLNSNRYQGHNGGLDKSLNQSLEGGSKKTSCMGSNGPPKNYYGVLKENLKTCAKGTKWRAYRFIANDMGTERRGEHAI